jgi:hypothetical protein
MTFQTFPISQKVGKALLIRVAGEESVFGRRAFYICIKRDFFWL